MSQIRQGIQTGGRSINNRNISRSAHTGNIGKYRNGVNGGNQKFPNKRRKIITGRELTTPLRSRVSEAQRKKYIQAVKEKPRVKQKVINVKKEKQPVGVIICIIAFSAALLIMMCSYIVLHEKEIKIGDLNSSITAEDRRERSLRRELDVKNDANNVLDYAVTRLGMVKEDRLKKYYLNSAADDKVTVIEEKNNPISYFANMMAAFTR